MKMNRNFFSTAIRGMILLVFFVTVNTVWAKKALVYKGPGSCTDGDCSGAAAHMAELEGFEIRFIGPKEISPELFEGVDLYIQPGGQSSVLDVEMDAGLQQNIRNFVASGGAYVGFCAGGFFAMSHIGEPRDFTGLGLIDGEAFSFRELGSEVAAAILPVQWFDQLIEIYWEGGPYFPEEYLPETAEIFGRYPSGKPSNIRSQYGLGRVTITAFHPEAPESWRRYFGLKDQDGLDYDQAREMIRWATSTPSPQ